MFKGLPERMELLGKVSKFDSHAPVMVTCDSTDLHLRGPASLQILRSNSQGEKGVKYITERQTKHFNKENQRLPQKVFENQHPALNLSLHSGF